MNDKINIKNLVVYGVIGINPWERETKQKIEIDLEIESNLSQAMKSDNINDTVNYRTISKKIIQHESLKEFHSNVFDIIFDQSFSNHSDSFNIRQIKNLVLNGGSSTMMIAPVDGYSTEGIDLDKNHHGVDIVSKKGDLIKSAQDGMVIFSGYNQESGNTIIISTI